MFSHIWGWLQSFFVDPLGEEPIIRLARLFLSEAAKSKAMKIVYGVPCDDLPKKPFVNSGSCPATNNLSDYELENERFKADVMDFLAEQQEHASHELSEFSKRKRLNWLETRARASIISSLPASETEFRQNAMIPIWFKIEDVWHEQEEPLPFRILASLFREFESSQTIHPDGRDIQRRWYQTEHFLVEAELGVEENFSNSIVIHSVQELADEGTE